MAYSGPMSGEAMSDEERQIREIYSKYSSTECKLFTALAKAKDRGDTIAEADIKGKIIEAKIPDFINRYQLFIQDQIRIGEIKEQMKAERAFHGTQAKFHEDKIDEAKAKYMQYVHEHASDYLGAYDSAMSNGNGHSAHYTPAHTNGKTTKTNGSIPAPTKAPKTDTRNGKSTLMKKRSGSTCTMM